MGIGRQEPEGITLKVWIDATPLDDAIRVFGMTLLERLLRSLLRSGAQLTEVRVALSPESSIPTSIPGKLEQALPLHWCREDAPPAHRRRQAQAEAGGEPILVLSADSVDGYTPLDERLRTFISRRNVNLAFFTLALLVDWLIPGHRAAEMTFYAIVAWQVVCLAWHIERVAQYWNVRSAE